MPTLSKIVAVTTVILAPGIAGSPDPVSALTTSAVSATPQTLFAGGLYVQPDSRAALAAPTLTDATQAAAARYISRRSVAIQRRTRTGPARDGRNDETRCTALGQVTGLE